MVRAMAKNAIGAQMNANPHAHRDSDSERIERANSVRARVRPSTMNEGCGNIVQIQQLSDFATQHLLEKKQFCHIN